MSWTCWGLSLAFDFDFEGFSIIVVLHSFLGRAGMG